MIFLSLHLVQSLLGHVLSEHLDHGESLVEKVADELPGVVELWIRSKKKMTTLIACFGP